MTVLYSGFQRCLNRKEKFEVDTERVMAIILDCDADRWFRPARDKFSITYQRGTTHAQYQPDFVAEHGNEVPMIETKARKDMSPDEVVAKAEAARAYCERASANNRENRGRPWRDMLVPHDDVAENHSRNYLAQRFEWTG